MRLTTICYIEQDGNYLMLHRQRKKMTRAMTNGWESVENLKKMKVRMNAFCAR